MYSRTLRAETRSRAKEENKRVNITCKSVRKWEKKWLTVKDTSMCVYKWVPLANQEVGQLVGKKGLFRMTGGGKKPPPRSFQLSSSDQFSMGTGSGSIVDSELSGEGECKVEGGKMSGAAGNTGATPISASQENSQLSFPSYKKGPGSNTLDSESLLNEDSNLSFPNPDSNIASLANEDDDTKSGSDFLTAGGGGGQEDSSGAFTPNNAKENEEPSSKRPRMGAS